MFSFLFFFKQKTAYEMRISDWSSDVCSSDLNGQPYAQASLLSERIVAAAEKTGIGLTMLPVLYQYSGFGAQPPRADQQRFINTPEQLMALLETLRAAYPEGPQRRYGVRSEEHTSELQSLMRISSAVFCLKKKTHPQALQHP